LVLLIGSVLSFTARARNVNSSDAPQLTVPAVHQHDNEFARVAKAVDPAVVNINTESTVKNPHKRLHRMPQPNSPEEEQEPDAANPNNGCRIGLTASSASSPTPPMPPAAPAAAVT
jgi:S1-C subfamily serine protease